MPAAALARRCTALCSGWAVHALRCAALRHAALQRASYSMLSQLTVPAAAGAAQARFHIQPMHCRMTGICTVTPPPQSLPHNHQVTTAMCDCTYSCRPSVCACCWGQTKLLDIKQCHTLCCCACATTAGLTRMSLSVWAFLMLPPCQPCWRQAWRMRSE